MYKILAKIDDANLEMQIVRQARLLDETPNSNSAKPELLAQYFLASPFAAQNGSHCDTSGLTRKIAYNPEIDHWPVTSCDNITVTAPQSKQLAVSTFTGHVRPSKPNE